LHERLSRGEQFYILDTRTEPEFLTTHLPGAYSTPGGELAQLVTDIAQDRSIPIVTNCAGRTRSLLGAQILRRMGFPQVYALKGGTGAWRIAGYGNELESGPGAARPRSSSTSLAACAQFAERIAVEDKIAFLTPQELQTRQQQGELLYLLDVRRLEEYRAAHLPGAHFCLGTQTALLVDSYVGVKNATVVTLCDARARAILAASLLKGMGYPRVFVLDGGVPAWQAQGFPLEIGEPDEIDYGQPSWLSRLMLGLPAGVQSRERPIVGLEEAKTQTTFLAPETLRERMKAGERFVLLDLRSAGDFATAHIPGARWLSRGRLDLEITRVVPERNLQIVLYCRRGKEAPLSTTMLRQLGYQQVFVLEGGFDAWKTADLSTEQGMGAQTEFAELAIAEVGLLGSGPYGYSNERMAKYLKDEEELGKKYRRKRAGLK
jgi:rhodanese-related sulfurtransferase